MHGYQSCVLLNNDVSNEFFLLSSNRDAQWGISRCEVDLACPSEFGDRTSVERVNVALSMFCSASGMIPEGC
jgi:acyl-ACP thioesterase